MRFTLASKVDDINSSNPYIMGMFVNMFCIIVFFETHKQAQGLVFVYDTHELLSF